MNESPGPVVSLEDDAPQQPAPVAAVPEPAPVAVAPPAPVVPDEPGAVEVDGQHMVPVGAVIAEREKRQAERNRADALEQQLRQTLELAQRLQQPAPQPAAPVGAPPPDPDVVAYAQTLSLYKADGTPDLEGASRLLSIAESRAERRAQAAVQPLIAQTEQERSAMNFRAALNITNGAGQRPSENALRAIWQQMPVQYTADPNIASILALTAFGADGMTARPPVAPPAQQPVYTEASGGNPKTRPNLSALEETIAAQRGVDVTKWKELTKGHTQGRPSVLED